MKLSSSTMISQCVSVLVCCGKEDVSDSHYLECYLPPKMNLPVAVFSLHLKEPSMKLTCSSCLYKPPKQNLG